jgi:hypothetical protein
LVLPPLGSKVTPPTIWVACTLYAGFPSCDMYILYEDLPLPI